MRIAYCDGRRLRRLFLAGSQSVITHRAELDRINVFPVPDGDTGTNLALTLRAMAESIAEVEDPSITGVAHRLADAGVMAARGNSGMMISHFFLGFAEGLHGRTRARGRHLADALGHAVDSLYQAVERPVEGTLLTVVRESAEGVAEPGEGPPDLEVFARRMLGAARASLARTPDLLPSLREAGVVDAGAKGFVSFLEGVVGLIEGRIAADADFLGHRLERREAAGAAGLRSGDGAYRYCSEYLVRGAPPPPRETLAAAVRALGDSLIVNRASTLAKIHIHTDGPEEVRRALAELGAPVECVKVEDMRAQHEARRKRLRRKVAVVTDTTCDLPPELVIELEITVVPMTVTFGDATYRDQIDIDHEGFLARLTDPGLPHPTTSQPAPRDLLDAYDRAAEQAGDVLGLFVSGALSGTVAQARSAADRFGAARVRVYDSRSASLGLGFLALRAAELAADGAGLEEIVEELERLRGRSGLFVTLDRLDYLRRSGRVGRMRAYLAGLLDLKPIISVDHEGTLVPVDRVRGRDALRVRAVQLLDEAVPREREKLRLAVVHVAAEEMAGLLRDELESRFRPDQMLVRPATGVLGAHTGPGAWAVVYQAE